ncbi:MAG TPA: nicotinate-nucleotide adenylyltransferase, partial [Actinomycetota bacterium]
MGGTFDPIHHGHLLTAEEAAVQFGLDEVVFVPTGQPWMKEERDVSSPEHRYLMTVIATASNPRFFVSRLEVDREGPTYTVDTLRELREQRGGNVDLFFVTGADAVLEIFQWKDPDEILELAHFI